jgi:hypothetical protein
VPQSGQRPDDASERCALLELVVGLLDDPEIGEREKRVGVGPKHRPDQPALHQVADVVVAEGAIARQQVARRMVLPLKRFG